MAVAILLAGNGVTDHQQQLGYSCLEVVRRWLLFLIIYRWNLQWNEQLMDLHQGVENIVSQFDTYPPGLVRFWEFHEQMRIQIQS